MRSQLWKRILAWTLAALTAAALAGCNPNKETDTRGVVISEIVTSNKDSLRSHPVYGSQTFTEQYGSPDWIELHNESDHAVDLLGWCITDNIKNAQKFELPDVTLQPDEYLVLLSSDKDSKTDALAWDGQSPIFLGFSLKSSGEELLLLSPDAQIVDDINVPKLNRDVSFARRADGTFGYCDIPTPGSANVNVILDVTSGVVISEVVSSNSESYLLPQYGSPDWIELHNETDAPINLLGWGITDNEKNSEKTFKLPDVTLAPDGYLLLFGSDKKDMTDPLSWDGQSPILIGFSLKSTGESVILLSPSMQTIDRLTVPELHADVSFARRGDGSFGYCETPTPGSVNVGEITDTQPPAKEEQVPVPATGVEISEISPRNTLLSCGGCLKNDWIELHNTTSRDIDLTGFTLCDEPRDYEDANLSGVLPANGYLVVYCCDEDCTAKDAHVCIDLGISRYGDTLYLFDPNGFELETVAVPEMPYKDVTFARRSDGTFGYCETPTPGAANTAEIKNDPPYRPDEPQNPDDTTEEAVDPTVGAKRPTGLRISEVLAKNAYSITDAEGERCDWVEILNASENPIPLAGWYLSDNPNNLTKWPLPENASQLPGTYSIIFLSGKTGMGNEYHANFSLSAGETLYLYNAKTQELDWITVPELSDNVSIGLDEYNNQVYYRYPTPGEPNGHAESDPEKIGFFPTDGVYISEVCAIHDRGSSEKDWIELYNGADTAVSLDGWYLSDSLSEPQKYRISSLTLGAHGYSVIETTTKDTKRGTSDASFGVSPGGETLYLSDADGVIRDAFSTGVQRNGMTSGRIEGDNQTRRVFFTNKTKGKQNSDSYYSGYTAQPVFSDTGLYHTEAFMLTITCPDPNAVIYYTTDGSEPDNGSKRYTEPLSIQKNRVIRAVAYADGLLKSEIVTYHYLFGEKHSVPIVCMAIEPDAFKKLYKVTVHKQIKGTETKAQFNYYESDGLIGVSFPADVKCKGQGTLKYAQKSLSVHLRGEYGMSTLEYPLFPDYPYTEFGALVLRNGGQENGRSRIVDSFVSKASIGMNVEAAMSRPVVLYVNGAYYGIFELGEDLNADYLETHYGADKDLVDLVRYNGDVATHGSSTDWVALRNYAKKATLSNDADYEAYLEKIDEAYFIDYLIARTFFCDTDMINQKYWRVRGSIKWRPLLFDLDLAMRDVKRNDVMDKYFSKDDLVSPHGYHSVFYVFAVLKTNKGFCSKFVERYVEIMYTQYDTERLLNLLEEMIAEYSPEMPRQIEKWNQPGSMNSWNNWLNKLRTFVNGRRDVQIAKLKKSFKISDSEMEALIAKYKQS